MGRRNLPRTLWIENKNSKDQIQNKINERRQQITRQECSKCARGNYRDGKCYADYKKGMDIKRYISCYWAGKKKGVINQKQTEI